MAARPPNYRRTPSIPSDRRVRAENLVAVIRSAIVGSVQVWSGPMKAEKLAVPVRAVVLLDACGEAQDGVATIEPLLYLRAHQ